MRFLLISANLFLLLALTVPINAQEPSFVPEKGEEVYREHLGYALLSQNFLCRLTPIGNILPMVPPPLFI